MLYIAGNINSGLVGNISVSLATFLLFSRVDQFSCFKALVTHCFPFRRVGSWYEACCSALDMISDIIYTDPIRYYHIPTVVSLVICKLDL